MIFGSSEKSNCSDKGSGYIIHLYAKWDIAMHDVCD